MRFAASVGWFRIERFASTSGHLVASDFLVEIRNLTYAYGNRPVLENIEMAIPRGKVVAIMGISGSGKTTILRLIGGVMAARRGELVFDGERLDTRNREQLYRLRRRMGMLFQFGALFTDLSVFDNVAFQIREHTDLPESMVRDLVLMKLHAVGMRAAHAAMPGELSGGMARRVALARAIALDPTLMMYDEPFTGLDPIASERLSATIGRLARLGIGVLLTDHNVRNALKIVERAHVIDNGTIIAAGTSESIVGDANVRATYLGSGFSL